MGNGRKDINFWENDIFFFELESAEFHITQRHTQ